MKHFRPLGLATGCLLMVGCLVPTLSPLKTETIVGFVEGLSEAQKDSLRAQCGATRMGEVLGAELWKVQVSPAEISKLPGVRYAQPNYTRHQHFADTNDPGFTGTTPLQWYLGDIHAPEAWQNFSDLPGKGVTVAVVDSGVAPTHPDLADNLILFNGKNLDEVGADYYGSDDYAGRDGQGHGTHVAGVIAGIANNGIGIVGGAPGAKILPVKTMKADGSGEDYNIARGIKSAVDHGANIINLSVGGPEPSPLLADAVGYALRHNVLMCISAGNDGGPVNYPAAYPGVIAVGSVLRTGERAYYSSYGPELDIVAYGGGADGEVYSTLPNYPCYLNYPNNGGKDQGYDTSKGTSMATPQVTAAAAVLLSKEPNLTPAQLRTRLLASARGGGFTEEKGYGVLDVNRALQWAGHEGGTP